MRPSQTLLALAWTWGTLAVPQASASPPPADDDVARVLRDRAVEHFAHEEYAEAFEAHAAAYRLEPRRSDACNAGTAARHAANKVPPAERGRYLVHAATFLALCTRSEPGEPPLDVAERAHRAKLSAELELVRQHVGALDIDAEDGADVLLGPRPLGRAPFRGLVFVEPGRHVLTARRSGAPELSGAGSARDVQIEVEAAADVETRVDLRPHAPSAALPRPSAPKPPPEPPSRYGHLTTAGEILAGLGAATALGVFIGSRVLVGHGNDYERDARAVWGFYPCDFPRPITTCEDMRDARNLASTLADVALAAAIGTGIIGAGTIAIHVLDRPTKTSPVGGLVTLGGVW